MFEINFSMYGIRVNKQQVYFALMGSLDGIENCSCSLKYIVENLPFTPEYKFWIDEEGEEIYIGREWNSIGCTWQDKSEEIETRKDFIESITKCLRTIFGEDIICSDFSSSTSNNFTPPNLGEILVGSFDPNFIPRKIRLPKESLTFAEYFSKYKEQLSYDKLIDRVVLKENKFQHDLLALSEIDPFKPIL